MVCTDGHVPLKRRGDVVLEENDEASGHGKISDRNLGCRLCDIILGWLDSAQARVGRPLTPVSVAGVARRQNRRAAYGAGWADSQPYWGARSYVGGYSPVGAAAV